jgi:hypothetical protein
MKLSEYDDDDLLEEVKHRGFKIEVICSCNDETNTQELKIGGMSLKINK